MLYVNSIISKDVIAVLVVLFNVRWRGGAHIEQRPN